MFPCANRACPNAAAPEVQLHARSRFHLCRLCRWRLVFDLVPLCGYVPSDALRQVAKDLRAHAKPTRSETKAAIQMMRGSRHRQGHWQDRPIYSAAVVHARNPRQPMRRRLPHILVGRRRAPTELAILQAFAHYHIAIHHLGLGHKAAIYLAGATFFGRRALSRPFGQRREYRGRVVRNAYHVEFNEFAAIGALCLKAAKVMGYGRDHGAWVTVRYLQGVETGAFHRPIIVPPGSGITSETGDHPLDHWLPRSIPWAPQYQRRIRRSSGKMHGTGEWPADLDQSIDAQATARREAQRRNAERYRINTTEAPSTDWIFDI